MHLELTLDPKRSLLNASSQGWKNLPHCPQRTPGKEKAFWVVVGDHEARSWYGPDRIEGGKTRTTPEDPKPLHMHNSKKNWMRITWKVYPKSLPQMPKALLISDSKALTRRTPYTARQGQTLQIARYNLVFSIAPKGATLTYQLYTPSIEGDLI